MYLCFDKRSSSQEKLKPLDQELIKWKNKAEILQDRVEQLENDKNILEQQVAEMTAEKEGR